ncbi:MAG: class I SAM-dependent methyltransferase [Chloroflexota bacterium]|nr:class I SAM-dependent methyltransferase [Chloroflexota bacterium]
MAGRPREPLEYSHMNAHFDLLAPFYDRLVAPPDLAHWRDLLQLPTAGWLLDAGGGTGRVSAQLAPLVGAVILSDMSRPMLHQASQKETLWPVQANVIRLPFPNNSFERVLVVDALHHFRDASRAIDELLRVLKPGGRLVIEEPDIERWVVKGVALVERLMLMQSRFYAASDIQQMVIEHDQTASIVRTGGLSVWVVVEKEWR